MRLSNDIESKYQLNSTVINYYSKHNVRRAVHFLSTEDKEWNGFDEHFLLDK